MRPASSSRVTVDGISLAVHDWGGSGPVALLAHPTGFHGVSWAPVTSLLLAAGFHPFSFDFRGHGDSERAPSGYAWDGFASDVAAVAEAIGGCDAPDAVAIGHSKGGAALLRVEADAPGTFARIWAYEPIVVDFPPDAEPDPDIPIAAAARRRRSTFDSREAARAAYATKPPLDVLDDRALNAYVEYGFRDRPDGRVELKCTPEDEAATFTMGLSNGVWNRLGSIDAPVAVVVGERTDAIPPESGRAIAALLPRGHVEVMAGLGHFGPLEDPEACVASILAFAAKGSDSRPSAP